MLEKFSKGLSSSLLFLALVMFFYVLKWGALVFLPLVVAFFIYSLFIPIVSLISQKLKVPKQISSLLVMLLVFFVLVLLSFPLFEGLKAFIKDLTEYKDILIRIKVEGVQKLSQLGYEITADSLMSFVEGLPLGSLLQSTTSMLSQLSAIGFLTFLYLTFMFMEKGEIGPRTFLGEIASSVRTFFWTKSLASGMSAFLIGVFLVLMGVPYALMFSVLFFILSFVPAIGQFLGTLLPLPIVYLNAEHRAGQEWILILIIFIVPNLIQSFFENFVWPKLLRDSIDLHPITILVSLIFWSLVWGVIGTFFAIPLTAVLRLAFDRIEELKPLAQVLRGKINLS